MYEERFTNKTFCAEKFIQRAERFTIVLQFGNYSTPFKRIIPAKYDDTMNKRRKNGREVNSSLHFGTKKAPESIRSHSLSKKQAGRFSYSPSADCKSKIGDMCGDFRAILLAKIAPLHGETAVRLLVALTVTEYKTQKVAFATFLIP